MCRIYGADSRVMKKGKMIIALHESFGTSSLQNIIPLFFRFFFLFSSVNKFFIIMKKRKYLRLDSNRTPRKHTQTRIGLWMHRWLTYSTDPIQRVRLKMTFEGEITASWNETTQNRHVGRDDTLHLCNLRDKSIGFQELGSKQIE